MTCAAVRVDDLGKQYRLGAEVDTNRTLGEAVSAAFSSPFRRARSVFGQLEKTDPNSVWALRNVSFQVAPGEVLGIIGRNGAGKSTLLKILSRITDPTEGHAEVRGRVGSLLEVGTGFHQELTGRENVLLNGAILGMPRREVLRRFDEIVAFSEVGRFIDTPVKRYSSGMRMRLAFSVAAHLDPDILVIDEVLAVGDAEFQRKCLGRISDVAGQGRTALFVSHNMAAVASLCSRAILLRDGQTQVDGSVDDVISEYLTSKPSTSEDLTHITERSGSGQVRFEKMELRDEAGNPAVAFRTGRPMSFGLRYRQEAGQRTGGLVFQIFINTTSGQRVCTCSNRWAPVLSRNDTAVDWATCHLSTLPLVPDTYLIEIVCKSDRTIHDHVWIAAQLHVAEDDFFGTGKLPPPSGGPLLIPQSWSY